MSQTFRTFAAVGDFDPATRSVPVVASTRNPVKAPYVDADGNSATRLESLESWDLKRFAANPIILAVHDQGSIAAIIGEAKEVRETPRGLEMRIYLASAHDAPAVVEVENKLRRKLLRGVSVGFSYGAETQRGTIDGLPYVSFTGNELNEVSFVPVPADADALIDTPETREAREGQRGLGCIDPPEHEKRKADLSAASKLLASARKPKPQPKLDAADQTLHQHFDRYGAGADKIERTQVGGVRVPARLTRTGVLVYRMPDGSVIRQLRLPEEVFDADSLASLRGAPVVAHRHHTPASGLVDASNWRERSLGHVEDVRNDERFVSGTLVVNDADTADAIERRELVDISSGYQCRHEHTSGVYDGEPYDLIHRDIRYNHVAVLPPGKGRAGREVSIQLDSNEAVWCFDESEQSMATPNTDPKDKIVMIKLDGHDYEYGSAAHIGKIETLHKGEVDTLRGSITALTAERDTLKGKFDAAEAEAKEAKKSAEDATKGDGEKLKSRIKSRVRLLMRAMRLFGEDDEEDDDKTEEKMDQFDGLSDREIMVQCLQKTDAFKEAKFDAESDDYVRGLFEHALKGAKPADGVDSVVRGHRKLVHDAKDGDDATVKAELERQRKEAETPAWKRPLQMTKG